MALATFDPEPLERQLGADRVSYDETSCNRCGIDDMVPLAVAEPGDTREIAEIVSWARSQRAALTPFTSGCYLPLGNPPQALDVGVSLRRLNRVLHYDPGDLTLSVQAGIPLTDVQKLLGENNLYLPADPPYADVASIGGLLAANASGSLRYACGTWRDFVVGLRFVTGEGKEIKTGGRVVKNVAGYDLSKLLIGSLGSLGIVTEVNLRVFPRPPESATFVTGFDTLDAALKLRDRLVHSVLQPGAIELFDANAGGFLDGESLAASDWSVAVLCSGVPEVLRRYETELSRLAGELGAARFAKLVNDKQAALWRSVRNLVGTTRKLDPNTAVAKCPLPLTQLGAFLTRARSVAARNRLVPALHAHAGTAVAFVYLLPEADARDASQRVAQAATEIIHAGNSLGGRVTLPWCPTAVKRDVNVWGPLQDDFALMQKLKTQFDPDRVLNPGRYLGGI